MSFGSILKQYDYLLPKELIAKKPSHPRDSARLLVYKRPSKFTLSKTWREYPPQVGERGLIKFDIFKNIAKYLPKNAVLVFNQTKVVPARLPLIKSTGGKVEVLYIGHDRKFVKVLANKKLAVGQYLKLYRSTSPAPRLGRGKLEVSKKQGQFYFLKPNFPINQITSVLQKYGKTPLPPYIKNSPLSEKQKRQQYQTVFAKTGISVAAPTASLHFTKKLMNQLKKQGIEIKFVNLDVNLGTFAPLTEKNLKSKKLHLETYEINRKVFAEIIKAKKNHRPIIAVGTTAVRTLESAMKFKRLSGQTNLFIRPPYKFKLVDGLITNFHVPKSSLMMLVSSLVGRKKLLNLYQKAIRQNFRFFSFGDGMLII